MQANKNAGGKKAMLSIGNSVKNRNRGLWKILAAVVAFALVMCPAAALYAAAGDVAPAEPDRSGEEGDAALITPVGETAAEGGNSAELGPAPLYPDTDGGEDGNMGSGDDAAFSQITGEVSLIHDWNGLPCIRVIEAEGGETDFVVEEGRTVFTDTDGLIEFKDVVAGAKVSVYYVKPLIMTLQYPPRYVASVVAAPGADSPGTVFAGIVNSDGRASDGSVVLNVSDGARIVRYSDGKAYAGAYDGRIILAYYTVTTRSLPPIALVDKVIVLDKMGVPVYVNGVKLFGAEAASNGDGVMLIPLRAVVEALGYGVAWDENACTARVGVAIYVKIDSDEYIIGRAAPVKLDAEAVLINSRTYVPLSFYLQILNLEYDGSAGLIKLSGATAKE
jgi:hypothetical protein